MDDKLITVEVVYAKPEQQTLLSIRVPEGSDLMQAIKRSGLLDQFPEIQLSGQKFGIFGQTCAPDRILKPGDRVEIYRPLIADPKVVRKERAAKKRKR